jgi:hypothetical protein
MEEGERQLSRSSCCCGGGPPASGFLCRAAPPAPSPAPRTAAAARPPPRPQPPQRGAAPLPLPWLHRGGRGGRRSRWETGAKQHNVWLTPYKNAAAAAAAQGSTHAARRGLALPASSAAGSPLWRSAAAFSPATSFWRGQGVGGRGRFWECKCVSQHNKPRCAQRAGPVPRTCNMTSQTQTSNSELNTPQNRHVGAHVKSNVSVAPAAP